MSNNRYPLTRRELLKRTTLLTASYLLAPTISYAKSPSPCVAVIDWSAVELLDSLQLAPIAVGDIANYRRWVVTPSLSDKVLELGLRNEPNLELLAQLRPDMIIVPQFSALSDALLSQFGQVLRFPFIQPGKKILTVAKENLRDLAQRIHRQALAEDYLQSWIKAMDSVGHKLVPFQGKRILLYSFLSPRQVLVMSPTSLFGEVLQQLNLRCAWNGSANIWGSAVIGVEQLFTVDTDIAMQFVHGDQGATAAMPDSGLWRQMPFVREQRNYQVDSVWMYGGLQAALRFARQLLQLSDRWHA